MDDIILRKVKFQEAKEFAILNNDNMAIVSLQKTPSFRDLIFFVYKDDIVIGLVILYGRYCPMDGLELQHVFLKEEYRKKGYYPIILKILMRILKKCFLRHLYLRIISSDQNKMYEDFYFNMGFEVYDTATIYKCNVNEESLSLWNKVKNNMLNRLVEWHKNNGVVTLSFDEADDKMLKLLKKQKTYSKNYNIKDVLNGVSGNFSKSTSFMSILDNKPVAISMVLEATPTQAVFQLISEDENYAGTGVYLPAVYMSMESLFKSKYETVSFCIFEYNKHMEKDAKLLFSTLVSNIVVQKSLKIRL